MKVPCKNCPNSGTVHTRCDKYEEFRKANEKAYEARHIHAVISDYHYKAVTRATDIARAMK